MSVMRVVYGLSSLYFTLFTPARLRSAFRSSLVLKAPGSPMMILSFVVSSYSESSTPTCCVEGTTRSGRKQSAGLVTMPSSPRLNDTMLPAPSPSRGGTNAVNLELRTYASNCDSASRSTGVCAHPKTAVMLRTATRILLIFLSLLSLPWLRARYGHSGGSRLYRDERRIAPYDREPFLLGLVIAEVSHLNDVQAEPLHAGEVLWRCIRVEKSRGILVRLAPEGADAFCGNRMVGKGA